ncbi:MAG TPA: YbaK/EbsC family protein [Candidatus Limnocylindria bacterium]
MDCRTKLVQYLTEEGVNFDVREHQETFTAQRVAAAEHIEGWSFAKVVMVLVDGDLQMLVLPAPERVDLDVVALALGARDVRLATEEQFAARFGDCELGAMPPFGNLYGIRVVADTTLAGRERIVFEAGSHTTSIAMSWADYVRLVRPAIVDFGGVATIAAS